MIELFVRIYVVFWKLYCLVCFIVFDFYKKDYFVSYCFNKRLRLYMRIVVKYED